MWRFLTSEGVGRIIRYEGMTNSDAYINIVTSGLKEYKTRLQKKELNFMQDNVSYHKVKKPWTFLKRRAMNQWSGLLSLKS